MPTTREGFCIYPVLISLPSRNIWRVVNLLPKNTGIINQVLQHSVIIKEITFIDVIKDNIIRAFNYHSYRALIKKMLAFKKLFKHGCQFKVSINKGLCQWIYNIFLCYGIILMAYKEFIKFGANKLCNFCLSEFKQGVYKLIIGVKLLRPKNCFWAFIPGALIKIYLCTRLIPVVVSC